MKLNVSDIVTVQTAEATFTVKVEDASKGDVIVGKVEKITAGSTPKEIGKVYEFSRNDIKS